MAQRADHHSGRRHAAQPQLRRLLPAYLPLIWALAACGGGGGDGQDNNNGNGGNPNPTPEQSATPGPDATRAPDPSDSPTPTPLPRGDGALGDPCERGGDCQSGLCWRGTSFAGCSVACEPGGAACDAGLVCRIVAAPAHFGCVPPEEGADGACATNRDCPYPTLCDTEQGFCAFASCGLERPCGAGDRCNLLTRRCEPAMCQAVGACTNPLDACREDGSCGPPQCRSHGECAAADVCVQGRCQSADACASEEDCPFYNEACVAGRCEPIPCPDGCADGASCDLQTGRCFPACVAGACVGESYCRADMLCAPDRTPFAAVRIGDGAAMRVRVGDNVRVSGEDSVEPDGQGLSYHWRINDAPPDAPGFVVGQAPPGVMGASFNFAPPVAGPYVFGLHVEDNSGKVSIQAQGWVFAE